MKKHCHALFMLARFFEIAEGMESGMLDSLLLLRGFETYIVELGTGPEDPSSSDSFDSDIRL